MDASIRIVLVDTSHPGNIGAAARAMRTMGLSELVLVRPLRFPDPEATALAAGGAALLERARVTGTIDDAVAGCGLVLGTTARERSAHWRVLDARAAAAEARSAAGTRPVAILFGNERNGLANDELARCQALLRVPTGGDYASLNLAQAVQVVCYELLMAGRDAPAAGREPAGSEELALLHEHLGRMLQRLGYPAGAGARRYRQDLERLLARALPDPREVRMLRGLFAAVEQRCPPPES